MWYEASPLLQYIIISTYKSRSDLWCTGSYNFYCEKMDYQQIEGNRRGSVLFCCNEYIYCKISEKNNTMKLRCREYQRLKCPAKATIDKTTKLLSPHSEHCHESQSSEVVNCSFIADLKKCAAQSTRKLTEIYETVAVSYPAEVVVATPYKKVRLSMVRARQHVTSFDLSSTSSEAVCGVCRGDVVERYIFIPCGHHPFCFSCGTRIMSSLRLENGIFVVNCPICRLPVNSLNRMFDHNNWQLFTWYYKYVSTVIFLCKHLPESKYFFK